MIDRCLLFTAEYLKRSDWKWCLIAFCTVSHTINRQRSFITIELSTALAQLQSITFIHHKVCQNRSRPWASLEVPQELKFLSEKVLTVMSNLNSLITAIGELSCLVATWSHVGHISTAQFPFDVENFNDTINGVFVSYVQFVAQRSLLRRLVLSGRIYVKTSLFLLPVVDNRLDAFLMFHFSFTRKISFFYPLQECTMRYDWWRRQRRRKVHLKLIIVSLAANSIHALIACSGNEKKKLLIINYALRRNNMCKCEKERKEKV